MQDEWKISFRRGTTKEWVRWLGYLAQKAHLGLEGKTMVNQIVQVGHLAQKANKFNQVKRMAQNARLALRDRG